MKKLVTFYSDSHEKLYREYFLPSAELHLRHRKIFSKKIDQLSPTGVWASKGFNAAMLQKIEWILENIDISDEDNLVFSDCDVQFFGNIDAVDYIGNFDIAFQKDYYENNACAGFFFCKQSKSTKNFFELVSKELKRQIELGSNVDDQHVINEFLKNSSLDLRFKFLPIEEFWTIGNITGGKVWENQSVTCPMNVLVHHANFTIGIENKLKLMKIVKDQISSV